MLVLHTHAQSKLVTKKPNVTNDDDIGHCFDYLHQGFMCSADATWESNTTLGTGWGYTHQCRTYTEIRNWANQESVF